MQSTKGVDEPLYPRPTVKAGDPMHPGAGVGGGGIASNPSGSVYPPADTPTVPPPPAIESNPSISSDLDALEARLKNLKS